MAGPIQPVPPGLNSALQIKFPASAPQSISETLVPTIDLREWYLLSTAAETRSVDGSGADTTGIAIAGFVGISALFVPKGEIWWIWEFAATLFDNSANTTIANIQTLSSVWTPAPNGSTVPWRMGAARGPISLTYAPASSPAIYLCAPSLNGFWAEAGSAGALYYAGAWTGGAPIANGRIRFSRFKV